MKNVFLGLGLLLLLVGCGGGGGDGSGGGTDSGAFWTATTLPLNTTKNGTVQTSDIHVPDGLYGDLFSFTITDTATINIQMVSADFIPDIFLFKEAALDEKYLSDWEPYMIDFSFNGDMTEQLTAGTYVIMATGGIGGIGAYNITVRDSFITPTWSYVQYRTYETPTDDRYMAWIQFDKDGQNISDQDIQSIQLFDLYGTEISPSATPQFQAENYISATWSSASSRFEQISVSRFSGYHLNLSNNATLASGTYSFQVKATNGQNLALNVYFPGKIVAPVVASSSMAALWNPDGSLTLSWTEPSSGYFDHYRVYLTDQSGKVVFFGLVLPGVNQVTLSTALVQQISQNAQISGATTINWNLRTRCMSNSFDHNNYAQGISNSVGIYWPALN